MAKMGLFGGNGQTPPIFAETSPVFSDPSSVFRRGEGGILPERGSRSQYDMVQALLQSGVTSSQNSGSPLLAFLAPMVGGAVGTRTEGLYREAQSDRDNQAIDELLSTMGSTQPPTLPGSRNPAYGAMAQTGGPTRAAAAMSAPLTERELLAKTLMAEAGGEGSMGMLAAGSVIANRANAGGYGDGLSGVIMKPGQFSAWNGVTGYAGGEGGLDMSSIEPSEDAYRVADLILSGQYQDPTGGATHYYNPSIANPEWGQASGGSWQQIGNHVFGFADGGQRTPARDAAARIAQGDFSTLSGFGSQPVSQGDMRTLIGLMSNPDVSAPIRDLAGSMITEAMGARNGLSPSDQISLAKDMLGLEAALSPAAPEPRFRVATPEEAAAYGAEAGQIGPDGRFYPAQTSNSSGDAGVLRQRNEATNIINSAVAGLQTQGFTREESMGLVARDPIFGPQFQILGVDPAEFARSQVQERADATQKDVGFWGRLFGRDAAQETAPTQPSTPAPDNDPLGLR